MLTVQRLVVSLLSVAFACGCSSKATLTLRDGSVVERKILRSDSQSVWVDGVEYWERRNGIGRGMVIETKDGKKFVWNIDAENHSWAPDDEEAWRQVCDEREQGDFCVPGRGDVVTEIAIAREDIADVSHPGTGAMVAGGVLLAVAGIFTVVGEMADAAESRRHSDRTDTGIGAGTPAYFAAVLFGATGLGVGTYGLVVHLGSRSLYQPAPPPPARPPAPARTTKPVPKKKQKPSAPPEAPAGSEKPTPSPWCQLRGCKW